MCIEKSNEDVINNFIDFHGRFVKQLSWADVWIISSPIWSTEFAIMYIIIAIWVWDAMFLR